MSNSQWDANDNVHSLLVSQPLPKQVATSDLHCAPFGWVTNQAGVRIDRRTTYIPDKTVKTRPEEDKVDLIENY